MLCGNHGASIAIQRWTLLAGCSSPDCCLRVVLECDAGATRLLLPQWWASRL